MCLDLFSHWLSGAGDRAPLDETGLHAPLSVHADAGLVCPVLFLFLALKRVPAGVAYALSIGINLINMISVAWLAKVSPVQGRRPGVDDRRHPADRPAPRQRQRHAWRSPAGEAVSHGTDSFAWLWPGNRPLRSPTCWLKYSGFISAGAQPRSL